VEKKVAQFLAEIGVVIQVDCLEELGNLFDQAVADSAMRLLTVPRAAVGSAESGGGDPMQKAGRKGVKTIARSLRSVCFKGQWTS
jgi:hypothetical protein